MPRLREKDKIAPSAPSSVINDDVISSASQYFRLTKAAALLECEAEDLLHLGTIGKAELLAPVVSAGVFEWPNGNVGLFFPEIDDPFQIQFNETDRVILHKHDLAKIEAIGWTRPKFFFAPAKAREVIAQHCEPVEDVLQNLQMERDEAISRLEAHQAQITRSFQGHPHEAAALEGMSKLRTGGLRDGPNFRLGRDVGFQSAWHALDVADDMVGRTELRHLFMAKSEVIRLRNQQPPGPELLARADQVARPEHGNTTRYSKPRIAVLQAVIKCLSAKYGGKRGFSGSELAKLLEEQSVAIWPEAGKPPLELSGIEELLRDALNGRIEKFPSRPT